MAKIYGKAGKSANKMGVRRELLFLLVVAILFLIIYLYFTNLSLLMKLGIPGVIVAVILVLVAKSLDKKGDKLIRGAKRAYKGANAEVKISKELSGLPNNYVVFNDISFAGGNVDHLVIAPTGVFVVETKSHKGKVTEKNNELLLNGKPFEKDIINQALKEAFWIKEELRPICNTYVYAILAFSNAFIKVRKPVKGVTIIPVKWLNDTILQPKVEILSKEKIEEISLYLSDKVSV